MSKGKNSLAAQVRQLITGVNKHYPTGSQQLQVGGATFTVTGLTELLQSFVDNREAVEVSRSAFQAKVQAEEAQAPSQLVVIREFEKVIRSTFGNLADVLADFGLAPIKARVPATAEGMAVAAAKRVATRKARGTMSSKQKKDIKGSITAKLVATPVTTSPVSLPVATPAPAASAPGAATAEAPAGNVPSGVTAATTPRTA